MAARIRAHDWAATPLGPIERWSQSLKTVVDLMLSSPGMMSLVWGDDAILLYNDAFDERLREHHIQALGTSAFETFARSRDLFAAHVAAGMAGRSARLLAQRHPVLRGGRLEDAWFDVDYAPVRDDTGKVAGVLWTLRDTTGPVLAERTLGESEVRHRLLIESWTQAVWETDAHGVVVADSASWRAYTGQTVEEWLGYGWLAAIHPDDRDYAERQWRDAVAGRGVVDAEFRLRAATGGWRWTNVRAKPLLDAAGNIEKWVGVNIDIGARKEAEAALRESEEKYRALFQSMDEAYAVVEVLKDDAGQWTDFRFLDANRAFMTHTSMPHPVGKTATELLGTPNPRWTELYGKALDTGVPIRVEETEPTLGRTFDLNIFALDPVSSRVAVLFTDVTARKQTDAALRDKEHQLRVITDAAPALISYLDADLRYRFANRRYEEWFGLAPGDIIGRHAREVVGDAAFERLRPHAEAALAGHRQVFEDELAYRLGGTRHVHSEFVPDVRGDGTVAGYHALVVDISDRHRVEDALRDSEDRLRRFGEASQDILWMRDAQTLDWTYLTPAFERIYGLNWKEALEHDGFGDWLELIVPEDRSLARDMTDRVLAGEEVSFECRIRRPSDGEIRWLRNNDFPIRGEHGLVTSLGGISQDITSIKTAEENLKISEERLRSAAEVAKFALWDWNIATGDVAWSDEHYRMEGYEVGEVMPSFEAWAARVHPDDLTATEAAIFAARDAHTEYVREFRSLHPDGSVHWHYARGRFFYADDGAPIRMIGAMLDTTARREGEERQKVLLAELQHRVRNILAVIRSIVSRSNDGERATEDYVQHLQGRISALARTQVLLTRRAGAGVDLENLIHDELVAQAARDEQFSLHGPDVDLSPKAAEVLALAIHELATNATKYGAFARAAGKLHIEWGVEMRDGQKWLVIDWTERGVPIVDAVPRRQGFGSELISRRIPYELKGTGSFTLKPGGLHSRIEFPLRAGASILQTDKVSS